MNLASALENARSSLAAVSVRADVVSQNVGRSGDPAYARRVAETTTRSSGGGVAVDVVRAMASALQASALSATSQAARQKAIVEGIDTLDTLVGDPQDGISIAARIGDFQNALNLYAAQPASDAVGVAALDKAKTLVATLNEATATVDKALRTTERGIADAVETVNSLLESFAAVDTDLVRAHSATGQGSRISDLQDRRDAIVAELAKQVGVTMSLRPDGSAALHTDSGIVLFDRVARTVTLDTSSAAGQTIVRIDGVDATSAQSVMPLRQGRIAGLVELRDTVLPVVCDQLDEAARGLIDGFAEADPATGIRAAGLFTDAGGSGVPNTLTQGLAARLRIATRVDPAAGGSITLLRDGGIAGPAFRANVGGGSGFSDRLQSLVSALTTPRTYDATTQLGASAGLDAFTEASAAWIAAKRQTANDASQRMDAASVAAQTALRNETGVSMDDEMARLLDIEHCYQASAKLMSVVGAMLDALLQATNA